MSTITHKAVAILTSLGLACLAGCAPGGGKHSVIEKAKNWVVYYDKALPASQFAAYDIVVFDDKKRPALEPLRDRPRLILGYVSFGESGANRPFGIHDAPGIKLEPNPWWPGNFILDVRKPEWKKFLLEEHIPTILQAGFDGIMIDTIDSPLYLETKDPATYRGLRKASVDLIRSVRERFPDMTITLNRGFDILPEVAPYIDLVLVESTLAHYDFNSKQSTYLPADVHLEYLEKIRDAQAKNPKLRALSLDYWPPEDAKGVAKLYRLQRLNGFVPYVSTVDLTAHHPEPQGR